MSKENFTTALEKIWGGKSQGIDVYCVFNSIAKGWPGSVEKPFDYVPLCAPCWIEHEKNIVYNGPSMKVRIGFPFDNRNTVVTLTAKNGTHLTREDVVRGLRSTFAELFKTYGEVFGTVYRRQGKMVGFHNLILHGLVGHPDGIYTLEVTEDADKIFKHDRTMSFSQ